MINKALGIDHIHRRAPPDTVWEHTTPPGMRRNGNGIHKYKSHPTSFAGYPARASVSASTYRRRPRYGSRALGSDKEKKFHDISDAGNSFSTAGELISLNLIPQGTTEKTRIGRKCWIKSINLRMLFALPASLSSQVPVSSLFRFLIILDKQANLALPATLDILETASELSYRNLANQTRFSVLKDWLETVDSPGGAGDGSAANDWSGVQIVHKYNKKCNIALEFNAAAGAITEITCNNLIVLALANNTNATWTLSGRLRFTD